MADFVAFDPKAPYDPEPVIKGTPDDHRVRGMMFNRMRRALREPPEHVAFKLYPLREYNELCVRAAQTLYPRAPLGQALWRVGELAAKAFTESMAGKTFMTLADGQLLKAVRGLPRAYQVVQSHGRVEVLEAKDDVIVVAMRDVWRPLPFHVGLLETAASYFGRAGDALVRELSVNDVELRFENIRKIGEPRLI